jgi:hypothetical protein
MHNPDPTYVGTIDEAHILARFPATEDAGFDVKVTASGIDGADELAVMLLLVIEQVTGVNSDLYVQQIDIVRRAAGLGPLTVGALR